MLEDAADENTISLRGKRVAIQFKNLVNDLAKRAKQELLAKDPAKKIDDAQVVILVDEYDKPILSNVDNPKASNLLKVLKQFYSVIKKCEGKVRFAFITGVSKFAHVSLFSDLNNLTDITLKTDYAGMLGFSEAEIRWYFADRIPLAAAANGLADEELMARLRGTVRRLSLNTTNPSKLRNETFSSKVSTLRKHSSMLSPAPDLP